MATKFFTNAQGNTLIREFEGILAANPIKTQYELKPRIADLFEK